MDNTTKRFAPKSQLALIEGANAELTGSMNDGALIRGVLVEAIRHSSKSRPQIADEMTRLVGREITERALNAYTAESKEDHRWPAELTRAFCSATGDDRLLRVLSEAAGLRVINDAESHLLELGRNYLGRARAERAIAALEQRLEGSEL
jgi:hypothetical protein